MYDVFFISEYIIWYSNKIGVPVNNLRLQKLLYFVQAEFMVSKNSPCFLDKIEAWAWGPVVPSVHQKYKVFSASSIPVARKVCSSHIDKKDRELINGIVEQCNQYSTSSLAEITQNQMPWERAYYSVASKGIQPESLKEFFGNES